MRSLLLSFALVIILLLPRSRALFRDADPWVSAREYERAIARVEIDSYASGASSHGAMHLVNKVAFDREPVPAVAIGDLRLRATRPEVRRNDTRIFFFFTAPDASSF